jgi:predicted thioredoxin/glutaredoxin
MAEVPLAILYARQGCHLCDDALALLRQLAPRYRFRIEVVDIESDDDLMRRYLFEIPVVVVDGRAVAKAPIRRRALEDALAGALRSGEV